MRQGLGWGGQNSLMQRWEGGIGIYLGQWRGTNTKQGHFGISSGGGQENTRSVWSQRLESGNTGISLTGRKEN